MYRKMNSKRLKLMGRGDLLWDIFNTQHVDTKRCTRDYFDTYVVVESNSASWPGADHRDISIYIVDFRFHGLSMVHACFREFAHDC